MVLGALSNTFHTVFKEKNDPNREIHLNMPVNIRFNFYKTPDDVKIENRFSIMPLRIPLHENMQGSYKVMNKLSNSLKKMQGFIYGTYAFTFWNS